MDADKLAAVADALTRALAPAGDELVAAIARTARAVFSAGACSVALLSDDGAELVFTTAAGGAGAALSGLRMPAGEGIAGWVATTGQPLAVGDLQRDPRFAADVARSTGYMPSAILAVPVELDGRLLGVLEILDRDAARAGADADLQLLELFAHQAALALEAAARVRSIGDLVLAAVTDPDGEGAGVAAAPVDDDLRRVAAAFATLAGAGDAARSLAVDVLEDVARFAGATTR